MKEKWIRINTIEGYEEIKDCYWVSNADEDKIMNRNTGKRLKPYINHGYLLVKLMTNRGKTRNCKIHILKASAFLFSPNPLAYNVVRHLNDVKTDNRLENLAWGTQSDNMKDCVKNGNFNYEAAARGGKKTATKNLIKNAAKNGARGGTITGAKNGKKRSKPVRCLETGIIYPSTKEAERCTGIANAGISHCCNGTRRSAGGFHFKFVDKEVNNNDMECK